MKTLVRLGKRKPMKMRCRKTWEKVRHEDEDDESGEYEIQAKIHIDQLHTYSPSDQIDKYLNKYLKTNLPKAHWGPNTNLLMDQPMAFIEGRGIGNIPQGEQVSINKNLTKAELLLLRKHPSRLWVKGRFAKEYHDDKEDDFYEYYNKWTNKGIKLFMDDRPICKTKSKYPKQSLSNFVQSPVRKITDY